MISINLAFDEEIASELTRYLANMGIDSKLEGTEVLVNQTDFDREFSNLFLKKPREQDT